MNEYYGVPSSDFFAHYGIKGMHWGIRRAKYFNSTEALRKVYKKALKKLNKLNKKADPDVQYKRYKRNARIAAAGLGVGVPSHLINWGFRNNDGFSRNPALGTGISLLTSGLGYGTAATAGARAGLARYRLSKKGHAKAVVKRDQWKKEMKAGFKGTPYANLPDISKKRRRRNT